MQLDFWQLSRDRLELVVAQIAMRTCEAGQRLLVVSSDEARRAAIGQVLWDAMPEAFLANGEATAAHAARQPILLASECAAINGARYAVLADGDWREGADAFERVFVVFGEQEAERARAVWRRFDDRGDVQRGYFAQENGKWVKKA